MTEQEKITESGLISLGFELIEYGDNPPFETFHKDGIEVWQYNDEFWVIDMLDQNNITKEFLYMHELALFFSACGLDLYPLSAINKGGGENE